MKKALIAILVSCLSTSIALADDATFEGDEIFMPDRTPTTVAIQGNVGIFRGENRSDARYIDNQVEVPVAKEFQNAEGKTPKKLFLKLNKKGQLVSISDGESELTVAKKKNGKKASAKGANW